jgi:hypothetical protein
MTEPHTYADGGASDIYQLYALHAAIKDSGGNLTRPVHKAIDELRAAWDRALRHAQASAAPPAPADADLRDRIAQALADNDGWVWAEGFDKTRSPSFQGYLRAADAVLAALPAPADRAGVLREAAVELRKQTLLHDDCVCVGELRRMADEAQQAEPEECNGICLHAADIGVPEAGDVVAYAHSDCPQHGEAQQAEPEPTAEPFIYTDADAAHLAIGAQDDGGRPVVSVVADEGARGHAAVYVLPEDIEHVVAALRDARRNAQALHDEAQPKENKQP